MAMLQMYVPNVSSVSDVCCNYFICVLQSRFGCRVVERGRELAQEPWPHRCEEAQGMRRHFVEEVGESSERRGRGGCEAV
jgi:hypothetical protein